MSKLSKVFGVAVGAFLLSAGAASASTSFSPTAPVSFDNGGGWESSVDGFAGETFQVQAIVNNTSDTDFNAISIDRVGDGVPQECHQFQEVTQTVSNYSIPFESTFSQSIGSAPYVLKVYGVQNSGQDFNCDSANVVATYNLPTNRIITNVGNTNSGGSTGGGSTGGSTNTTLEQKIAAIVAAALKAAGIGGGSTGGSTSATACAALQARMPGTSYGVYNDANVSMQGFLLADNPNSIPALKAGSTVPMGYYGPQTAAAVSAYKAKNGCV